MLRVKELLLEARFAGPEKALECGGCICDRPAIEGQGVEPFLQEVGLFIGVCERLVELVRWYSHACHVTGLPLLEHVDANLGQARCAFGTEKGFSIRPADEV
jgi:hypothetical protein